MKLQFLSKLVPLLFPGTWSQSWDCFSNIWGYFCCRHSQLMFPVSELNHYGDRAVSSTLLCNALLPTWDPKGSGTSTYLLNHLMLWQVTVHMRTGYTSQSTLTTTWIISFSDRTVAKLMKSPWDTEKQGTRIKNMASVTLSSYPNVPVHRWLSLRKFSVVPISSSPKMYRKNEIEMLCSRVALYNNCSISVTRNCYLLYELVPFKTSGWSTERHAGELGSPRVLLFHFPITYRAEKKPSPGGGPEEAFVQTKPPSNISGGFLLSTIGALLIQTVPIRVFLWAPSAVWQKADRWKLKQLA